MPKVNTREYRNFAAADLELRKGDGGEMTVEGYATTFSQPYILIENSDLRYYEEVSPDAFDQADMSDVIMQYDHEGRVFARMSNGTLGLAKDEKGLKITARLDGTELGRQLYEEIAGGYTTKMSFGFVIADDGEERTIKREAADGKIIINRKITKVRKVYDVSAVSLPANPATAIYSRGELSRGALESVEEEIRAIKARDRDLLRLKILMEV